MAFDLRSWLTGFALGLSGKPLPLSSKTPIVPELPELPEWDKETYPYMFLYRVISSGKVILCVDKYRPFHTLFYTNPNNGKEFYSLRYNIGSLSAGLTDGVWSDFEVHTEVGGPSVGENGGSVVLFSNFDIISADGSVWMKASTANYPDAPSTPADPVLPIPSGVTHCLYNGEKFPVLNEWDIKVYPYVFLCAEFWDVREVIASRCGVLYEYHATGDYHINCHYDSENDKWGAWSSPGSAGSMNGTQVWANYDVYDDDGVLQLAASDPVPVTE